MKCYWIQNRVSKYLEGELGRLEAFVLRMHLAECRNCLEIYERMDSIGSMVRDVGAPAAPLHLKSQIQSAVSIESARRAEPHWRWNRFKMRVDDLMRPLAVPAIGGVLSALLLVTALLSALWMTPSVYADDIPVKFLSKTFLSNPMMKMWSPYPVDRDFMVLAYINAEGEVYDFEVAEGELLDARSRGQIGNALLMSQFQPAMNFGQPMRGEVFILFQRIENEPLS